MTAREVPFVSDESEIGGPFPTVVAKELLAVRRALLPGRSLASQAWILYSSFFVFGMIALLLRGIWDRVGQYFVDLANPYHLIWGPPAVLLLIIGILRYNTVQGFVSFSEPDCAHVLMAPVSRRALTWPRLRTMTLVFGFVGAVVGVLAGVASGGTAASATALGEEAAAGIAMGVILVAVGWQVQRSGAVSRWVVRLTVPALAVVLLLAIARWWGGIPSVVALWSGPWGWAALPARSGDWWQGVAGVVLLWLCAAGGFLGLLRSAGLASLENFQRRARTRSHVVASLYSLDARSAVRATRQPRYSISRLRLRPRVPRHPLLTPAWRGLLALFRSPLRLAWGIVLGGGAALLLAIGKGSVGTSWSGALLLYLAAGALLEPMRMETDSPAAPHLLLPWSFGRVLWLHCLLPATILVATGIVAAALALAAGYVGGITFLVFIILWLPVAPAVVLAAALSSRSGGRASSSFVLMTAGDSTGMSAVLVVVLIFFWAIAAIVAVALGVGRIAESGSVFAAIAGAVAFCLVILMLRSTLLSSKPGKAIEPPTLFKDRGTPRVQ